MIEGIRAAGLPEKPRDTPEKIHRAASQFEALLLTQLLRTARESGGKGWLGTGEDDSASAALEMAEEQFAQMMAAGGGLGLAKLVAQGLEHQGGDTNSPTDRAGVQRTQPE